MEYRAVGNRCAVDLGELKLPIPDEKALRILLANGFKVMEVNLVALARQCIGKSKYRRGAKPSEAPGIVDCSSFVKWLYGRRGIWLPRFSIQQRDQGERIELENVTVGDLIFVSGRIDWYLDNPADGVGHVGIATGNGTVIHAANKKIRVTESRLQDFASRDKFRGARRYVPENRRVITLETPVYREVETADEIRWIVLQSL